MFTRPCVPLAAAKHASAKKGTTQTMPAYQVGRQGHSRHVGKQQLMRIVIRLRLRPAEQLHSASAAPCSERARHLLPQQLGT